jgi:hypothetical protein
MIAVTPIEGLTQDSYRVGDRVEWNLGDIWYKGTIYNVQGDRYQVERDGYGRASELIRAADLRRLPETTAVPPARNATPQVAPNAVQGRFKIGDRVEWNIGDGWYAGTVYREQNGQYQINRDQYGRGSEWTTTIRSPLQPKSEQPMTGSAAGAPFYNGERIEVNIGGAWHRANIGVADNVNDRYIVDRESPLGSARADETVASAQIRRLGPATGTTARAPLPRRVPEGLYECQLFLTNGGFVGRLRILPGDAYQGLSTTGGGPQSRFSYDPATGKIDWVGGLQGFSFPIQGSALESNPLTPATVANGAGSPSIVIHYQLRAGGSINSISCVRTGG